MDQPFQELKNLSAVIDRMPDVDDFLEAGLAWLEGITAFDLATVWQLNGDTISVRAARGRLKTAQVMQHSHKLADQPDLRRALLDRMPRINTEHDHAEGDGDLFDDVIDLVPGHSCMVVPLAAGDQTLGLLSLDRNVCEPYTPETLRLVDLYARILALGLMVATRAEGLKSLYLREKAMNTWLAEEGRTQGPTQSLAATRNPALRAVIDQARAVAPTTSSVLITGETGTGKEVLALAVHQWSERRDQPYIKINCAALPEGMLESELFGHVKGAFTGATRDRDGRFRAAHGGTLFLDEIGDMPLGLQAKLLRALQEGTFEPVGSDRTVKVDVRVIAATNANLAEMIAKKRFRADLYYRINVLPLHLPPLRERPEDIKNLADVLLRRLRSSVKLGEAGLAVLQDYAWPGNIRELSNVLERAVLLARQHGRDTIDSYVAAALGSAVIPLGRQTLTEVSHAPVVTLVEATRQHMLLALTACDGKIYGDGGAAALLGMKPSTLQSKMQKLGLKRAFIRKKT